MRHWRLEEIDTPNGTRSPVVLHSEEGADRVILLEMQPGEELGEHRVRESALLLVLEGSLRVESGDESFGALAEDLVHFDPGELRTVMSEDGARVLLFLAPWPGEGHYGGEETRAGVSAS